MARKVNKEDSLDSAGKRDRKRKRKTTVNGCPAYRHTGTPSDPLHCVGVAFVAQQRPFVSTQAELHITAHLKTKLAGGSIAR